MRNDYGRLVEAWKVDLILERAKRKSFRRDELQDAQQDVILAISAFRFDASRSNGATERTVLIALIDKQLTFLQRGAARRRKHEKRYWQEQGGREGRPAPEPLTPDCQREHALALDVREAVQKLSPAERAVCDALARGDSRVRIARLMYISRYRVSQLITAIRVRFAAMGIEGWVCE